MYRGHVHRFIFLFICVHTDVRFDPLFCIMAMWHGNFCTTLLTYIHIYNIKQGSNLYTCIYGWLDLVVHSLESCWRHWIFAAPKKKHCVSHWHVTCTTTAKLKNSVICHKKTALLSGILRIMPKCSENSIYLWIESYKESMSKFHFISISISNIDCT